jgi:hypothetical protein
MNPAFALSAMCYEQPQELVGNSEFVRAEYYSRSPQQLQTLCLNNTRKEEPSMETAKINHESQEENNHMPTEEASSRTAAHGSPAAETTTAQISGSLGERNSNAQKGASKYLWDQRAAKHLAAKKRKKMAHRRSLRASHTKG